jgi:hypothetical protein
MAQYWQRIAVIATLLLPRGLWGLVSGRWG